ncbi:MAG: C1 family peptidase [Ezakiella sp.]|nr:hypothetical protein [Ezakiella sp.]MDY3947088.1 C1 family peptidase [Ezakiella sp.]
MNKVIDKELLNKFKENYKAKYDGRESNMISQVGLTDASLDREKIRKNNAVFSKLVDIASITDQKQSGRCWMFAGLNVLKTGLIKKWKLKDFKFSQNYLYFYDKLERASQYLEDVIELGDNDLDDRLTRQVVFYAAEDGAWWTTFSRLIEKYGIVPEYAYPDTINVEATNPLIDRLEKRLKIAAKDIRNAIKEGKNDEELDVIKEAALQDVYNISAIALGIPPKRFDLYLKDKDGNVIERRNISPKEFYNEFINTPARNYVELGNYPYPDREEGKLYEKKYLKQRVGGKILQYYISMDRMKELVVKAIDDNEPVWFAADVGKDSLIRATGDTGYLLRDLINRDLLLDIDTNMNKTEGLITRNVIPTHAMTFVGYDRATDGLKFKVENSWGAKLGKGGYLIMDEDWFDNYVFEIIVDKKYLNDEEIEGLKQDPIELMPFEE